MGVVRPPDTLSWQLPRQKINEEVGPEVRIEVAEHLLADRKTSCRRFRRQGFVELHELLASYEAIHTACRNAANKKHRGKLTQEGDANNGERFDLKTSTRFDC